MIPYGTQHQKGQNTLGIVTALFHSFETVLSILKHEYTFYILPTYPGQVVRGFLAIIRENLVVPRLT